MTKSITIWTDTSDESMVGGAGWEGYDAAASTEEFLDRVSEAVSNAYPGYRVTIQETNARNEVKFYDELNFEEEYKGIEGDQEAVRNIISEIWQNQEWYIIPSDEDYVSDAFVGKLGVAEDYSWITDGVDFLADFTDDQIRELVDVQARAVWDHIQADYEQRFGEPMEMTFEQFKRHSDYQSAYDAARECRDAARTMQQLNEVMTAKEIAEDYDIKEDTVRDACQHDWITARKSGTTWLILRKDAETRWGKRKES